MSEYDGKHRAEKQPKGQSTSEQVQGTRNDASKSKHAAGKTGLGRTTHRNDGKKKS